MSEDNPTAKITFRLYGTAGHEEALSDIFFCDRPYTSSAQDDRGFNLIVDGALITCSEGDAVEDLHDIASELMDLNVAFHATQDVSSESGARTRVFVPGAGDVEYPTRDEPIENVISAVFDAFAASLTA
jgi:hypothetical protein